MHRKTTFADGENLKALSVSNSGFDQTLSIIIKHMHDAWLYKLRLNVLLL